MHKKTIKKILAKTAMILNIHNHDKIPQKIKNLLKNHKYQIIIYRNLISTMIFNISRANNPSKRQGQPEKGRVAV